MELVTPDIGLLFWMTLVFLILLFLLGKFAWKPIMKALKDREDKIDLALKSAEQAREEMAKLEAGNKQLMQQAREERERILKEAEKIKTEILNEAKEKAKEESNRILASAKDTIRSERQAVIAELKEHLAELSLEIAEKILKEDLSHDEKQKKLINNLLDDISIN